MPKDFLLGKLIGEGGFRKVYEKADDPTKVVKVTRSQFYGIHCNTTEYHTWDMLNTAYLRDLKLNEYPKIIRLYKNIVDKLCPVYDISDDGSQIVMAKTTPLTEKEVINFPRYWPAFLTDFKLKNFGILDGKIVCHDYGGILLINTGFRNRRITIEDIKEAINTFSDL